MGRNDQTLVIGLGRFGRAIAETLGQLGHEVLGVDAAARTVQACSTSMTHVVQADATDADALRQLGAGDFPSAVVAIGSDIQASILVTYALVDLEIPRIWAKAITAEHGAILQRVGAHRVIFPERDMGVRMAHSMVGRTIDYIEIDENFVLIETTAPREAVGQTLEAAGLRKKYDVTVVCVKNPGGTFTYATPETVLQRGDLLVVAGSPERAETFAALD
ncbi:potassium channel family protein [Miltoncostaea oceani]|uniref:potassium channel family protein n=1 Tax=Miltoncostaea oceani TaxID=2843216 RepID=UPI001C3CF284|nr:TrkA family potassium uptake protein [Miltoncostaea oceani]